MPAGRAPILRRVRDSLERLNTPFRHAQDALRFPFSERRWARGVERSLEQRPELVLVYSAPKTASTSVADALERLDAFTVIKVHHLQPAFFWPGVASPLVNRHGGMRHKAIQQRPTRALLQRHPGPVRTVSLIREPIGFNVSNFTYFGRGYWLRTCWRSAPWMGSDELLRRFLSSFPHGASEAWWKHEFVPSTGIDPLSQPFDAERGWQVVRSGRFESLLIRADIPDDEKSRALRAFLGRDDVPTPERLNPNEEQSPPVLAARLRQAIRGCPEYVERLMEMPSVRHFWTDGQRRAIIDGWTREPTG
jgi:hypothetical protein